MSATTQELLDAGKFDLHGADHRASLKLAGQTLTAAARQCRLDTGGGRLDPSGCLDVRCLIVGVCDGLGKACVTAVRCGFVVKGYVSIDGDLASRR